MDLGTTIARSAALGFACGLRSMAGPAMLAVNQGRHECAGRQPAVLRLLRSDLGRVGIAAAAIGEAVIDKLPILPARIDPQPLAGRVFLGALSGLLAARTSSRNGAGRASVVGAVAGGLGAYVGTFAGYHARRAATLDGGLPDRPVALVEDVIAYAVSSRAARW
jgi:uncharacterized membrane protein